MDFTDLTEIVGLAGLPGLVAPPAGPSGVARWWSGMSEEQRRAWIARDPDLVGDLEGVPAWARDEANRILVQRLLLESGAAGHDVALATATEIRRREDAGETVQLYEFDPAAGLVALGLGDLDTADDIGVLVPGTGTTAAADLDAVAGDAATLADAAAAAAPTATVATLAWIGYRTPPGIQNAYDQSYARAGGAALDTTLGGLAAARSTTGRPAHTVVYAHSYGAEVVAEAAGESGELPVDDVVLLGPPGMAGDAGDLEADDVYYALGGMDPIRYVPLLPDLHGMPVFANPVWYPDYGATELPVEAAMGHSDYYDPDRPTVAALGQLLVDQRPS